MLALLLASWAPGVTQPQNTGAVAPRDAERAPLVEAALKRLAAKAAIRRIVASTLVATPSKTLDTTRRPESGEEHLSKAERIFRDSTTRLDPDQGRDDPGRPSPIESSPRSAQSDQEQRPYYYPNQPPKSKAERIFRDSTAGLEPDEASATTPSRRSSLRRPKDPEPEDEAEALAQAEEAEKAAAEAEAEARAEAEAKADENARSATAAEARARAKAERKADRRAREAAEWQAQEDPEPLSKADQIFRDATTRLEPDEESSSSGSSSRPSVSDPEPLSKTDKIFRDSTTRLDPPEKPAPSTEQQGMGEQQGMDEASVAPRPNTEEEMQDYWADPRNWKVTPVWTAPKANASARHAKKKNYTDPKSYWKDPKNWHQTTQEEAPESDPWRDLKKSLKDRFGIGEGEGPWNTGGVKFHRHMGRGININPWSLHRLTRDDYIGMRKRGVGHVRLGGNVAEPLQDWTTCPASTKTLKHLGGNDTMARQAIINSLGKDPTPMGKAGFRMLKQAATDAVAAGLKVVLDPFHRRLRVAVNSDTLRWIWGAMLAEYSPKEFPYDQVAFEMVRLPISYVQTQYSNVEGQFQTMIQEWVTLIRAKQPGRPIILTAVQTVTDDTMHVSSYEALMRYSSILSKQSLSALNAAPVMLAFEISPWVANDRDETDDTMGMEYGGYSCNTDQSFCKAEFYQKNHSERAANMVKTHLLRLGNAYPEVPIYVASYGMPTGGDNRDQWLRTIREGAERAHMATAVYDYIGSQSSLICADDARKRMGEMDRSNEIAAVFNLSVVNASQPACTLIKAVSAFKRIPRTGCVCSMDERSRPLWAYPYFVPKTGGSDNAQLSVGSTIKKTLNDTKELHLGDAAYPGFEHLGTYRAKFMDVGPEHKNFGAAPFPLGEAYSITMPDFVPRVRATAEALGLKVNIVEPVSKATINISDPQVLKLFPPGVTDHLTFGEMAITLSHRKAWQQCIDDNLPACLFFEDDFTAVGPELRKRLDAAVALLPHDWQFLQLGRCWDPTCDVAADRVSPDADLFRANKPQMGTCFHAYAVTRKGAFELQEVAKYIDIPIDHGGTFIPARDKRFYISPALFTQNPALRLVDSTSKATMADIQRGAVTVDNTFRPALVPECASSDPRRLTVSAHVPGLRATGAALAMQSTQILWHVRTGIEHHVPACLNLINKSKGYLILDRAWIPDMNLDFDYYGCVLQYSSRIWLETDPEETIKAPTDAINKADKKKLVDEMISMKVGCLTHDCTPSATLLPRCPVRTTRHAGLEAWERLGGILKLAGYSPDMPDSTRQTEIATALTDGVEELPASQYTHEDWEPEASEEEKSAEAEAEALKPAQESLADALGPEMAAAEEKLKAEKRKLKGRPPSITSLLLANSERYNYLPLPTPGPQAIIRAPSSATSKPAAPSPNPEALQAEIEAVHDILKARANGIEAIKTARDGVVSVPKQPSPHVIGSPELKNGIPAADPHQAEIDAILAARQRAIDAVHAARDNHAARNHAARNSAVVQQDHVEIIPSTDRRLPPKIRAALKLYADTISAEVESEEQSKELAAALALRNQKTYDAQFGQQRQDGVTRRRFLGGFESPDWPKPPSCAWQPGLRQAPDVRVQERGDRLTKYVNHALKLEVRPILKVGSMMIMPLLQCLQEHANNLTKLPPRAKRSNWTEVAQRTPTPDNYRAHTLVRSPISRFASTFSEVLRRAFLYECPMGPCEAERGALARPASHRPAYLVLYAALVGLTSCLAVRSDFFTVDSLATVKKQAWYPSAARFCKIPLSKKGYRKAALREAIGQFTATSACNLQYYGAEHTMTQTMQLVAQGGGPIKPWAGEVAIHHLEEIATPSLAKSSTFLKAMRLDGLSEDVISSCFGSNLYMTHGSRPAGDRRLPGKVLKQKKPKGSVNLLAEDEAHFGDLPNGTLMLLQKDEKPFGAGNEGGAGSGVGKAPGCELPESSEVMDMIQNDPALLLPLTAAYAQDMLCLGYPPPDGLLKFIGDVKFVRGGFAARFVENTTTSGGAPAVANGTNGTANMTGWGQLLNQSGGVPMPNLTGWAQLGNPNAPIPIPQVKLTRDPNGHI